LAAFVITISLAFTSKFEVEGKHKLTI